MSLIKDKHYIIVRGTEDLHDKLLSENKESFIENATKYLQEEFKDDVECVGVDFYNRRQNESESTVAVLIDDNRDVHTAEEANKINPMISGFVESYVSYVTEAEHNKLEGW